MSVIAVTRHPAIRKWLARQGIRVDRVTDHLEVDQIRPGDTLVGTLPVHLAAEVCRRGGRYLHLVLDLPPEAQGVKPPNSWTPNCTKFTLPPPPGCGQYAPVLGWRSDAAGVASAD